MDHVLGRYSEYSYALLRIMAGFLFAQHGAQKLFGMLGGMGGEGQSAELFSLMGLAGIVEFFGGVMIALGLFGSWVAFVASGEMAFAYFLSHAPQGFWAVLNNGERAVLFCFFFLYMATRGSGIWSLDRAICRR